MNLDAIIERELKKLNKGAVVKPISPERRASPEDLQKLNEKIQGQLMENRAMALRSMIACQNKVLCM